jgi:hypothetical protein
MKHDACNHHTLRVCEGNHLAHAPMRKQARLVFITLPANHKKESRTSEPSMDPSRLSRVPTGVPMLGQRCGDSVHVINKPRRPLTTETCGREAPQLDRSFVLCSMEPHLSTWLQCLAPTDSVYDDSTTFPFPKHDPSALSPLIHPLCHGTKVALGIHPGLGRISRSPPLLCMVLSCPVPRGRPLI